MYRICDGNTVIDTNITLDTVWLWLTINPLYTIEYYNAKRQQWMHSLFNGLQ